MIWGMPVYPSTSERLFSPAVRVRGADDSLPAGFQYLMNVPQKGRRIRCMLDHLVERDNIELLWSIAGRLEQARRNIESVPLRSEEHTSELQSLMRISYAVFCLKKKKTQKHISRYPTNTIE